MRNISTKRSPHIVWVCPNTNAFFRAKGEVRSRPGSVIPKLVEHGLKITVVLPFDATLLPKTKLSASRIARHKISLGREHQVEIVKLTRGTISPAIYMVQTPAVPPPVHNALMAKAAIALVRQIKRPADIFHLFDWEPALLPLFLQMERDSSPLFRDARTFLNVRSLGDQGNFSPGFVQELGLPLRLFHPDGIEFYGQISFLKAGLLFADGVGLIESGRPRHRNGSGLEGVLDSQLYKLRRWASERSLRSHLDAYEELLSSPRARPILPKILEKLPEAAVSVDKVVESWGPVPRDRYRSNGISFLVQSPMKAYAFWEWQEDRELGIVLEDIAGGRRTLLGRGLGSLGEFWISTEPDRAYAVELVGWNGAGRMETLLRSNVTRTPRNGLSPNTRAVFIDVRSRRRYGVNGYRSWNELMARLQDGTMSSREAVRSGVPLAAENLPSSVSSSSLPSSFGALPSSPAGKR